MSSAAIAPANPPVGRRMRYELADARLGHAIDDLRTAVLADRTCPDAAEKGCC